MSVYYTQQPKEPFYNTVHKKKPTFVPSDSSCCECDGEVVTAQFILRQVVFLSCDGVLSTIHFYLHGADSGQEIHAEKAKITQFETVTSSYCNTLRASGAC